MSSDIILILENTRHINIIMKTMRNQKKTIVQELLKISLIIAVVCTITFNNLQIIQRIQFELLYFSTYKSSIYKINSLVVP